MFRDVPECSGMFHVPGFIDARLSVSDQRYTFLTACLLKPSAALCPIPQNALTLWPRV